MLGCSTSEEVSNDYNATISKSMDGTICQRLNGTETGLGTTSGNSHNFCPNPNNKQEEAWCYTIPNSTPDSTWKFCDCGMFIDKRHSKTN